MMNVMPLTLAAAVFVGGSFLFGATAQAGPKAEQAAIVKTAAAAIAKVKNDQTGNAKPKLAKTKVNARRPKLPREWVWKKYAKSFDQMFRQKK